MSNLNKTKKIFTTANSSVLSALLAAGGVRKKSVTQTLNNGNNTVVHSTGIGVQAISIYDNLTYIPMDYNVVDVNTITVINPGAVITNATIKIVY